jgi:hypothetical protein
MISLTEDSLVDAIANINKILGGGRHTVIDSRPTKIIVSNKLLRLSFLVMYSKHLKFMYKQPPSNARKRSKARQHQSFITPRWAI